MTDFNGDEIKQKSILDLRFGGFKNCHLFKSTNSQYFGEKILRIGGFENNTFFECTKSQLQNYYFLFVSSPLNSVTNYWIKHERDSILMISSQKVGVRKHLLHSVGIENNVFLNSFLTDHSYDSTRSDCPVPLSVG